MIKATKAVIQGIKVLVFSEVGNLLETVNATPDFLAQYYGYEKRCHQCEDEMTDHWFHNNKPVPDPDWDKVRMDFSKDVVKLWSYEEDV